jgi:hypothetical protein
MNRLFSQTELKKIKQFIYRKPLNEQRWLDDVITSAKSLDTSKNIFKNIPDIKLNLKGAGKSFNEFIELGNNIFKKIEIESLVTKSEFTTFRKNWDDTIKNLTLNNKVTKDIPDNDLINFVKGKDLSGDNLKKITPDELEYIVSLQVLNRQMVSKIDDIENNFNKLFAEKLNEYIKINGDGAFKQLKSDLGSGKKTSEEVWQILKNPNQKQTDLPKSDIPKNNPEQVAGLKLSDIPKDEYDIIDASFKKYGFENDWGFDTNTGEPIYVTLQINGQNVKFSLNKQGPEELNWDAIIRDDLENFYKPEFEKTFENMEWYQIPSIWDWIRNEKILKNSGLRSKYTKRYDVSLGVKMWATDINGNWSQWVIINPVEIANYRKPKNLEELKNSIFQVIYHELTHVIQKKSIHSDITYKSNDFKDGKEAWGYLTGKRLMVPTKDKEIDIVDFNAWQREDFDNCESAIRKFGVEKNIDTSLDYSWLQDFKNWAKENGIVPEKYLTKEKRTISGEEFKTNLFSNDVKIRSLRFIIDGWEDFGERWKNIKEKTKNLDNEKFLKFFENNLDVTEVDEIVKSAAKELSYWSHIMEIEAEFTANVKTILELGTLEKNKGFATFLVDYLRGTNKSQKLADINFEKTFKSEIMVPTKVSETPKTNIEKIKGIFKSFIDKFLNKNITDEVKLDYELKDVDNWVQNIPKDFFDVLGKLEHRWKKIYPEQAKKIEKDLYRQAYELISKGYPALLPFIVSGLVDDENETTKNESVIYKKSYLTESIKKTYSFDWDDNILKMPTRIHLEYKIGGLHWVPVSVSTQQFRSIRHKLGDEFRYINNNILDSFKDFRDYESFIKDVKYALDRRSFGPSFNDFKEALINGDDFSIITARSNSPQSLSDGIKVLIDNNFTYGEKEEMKKNLKGSSIDDYLRIQDYHPVSSEEFLKSFGLEISESKPEKGKEIAFESFVDRIVNQIDDVIDEPDFEGISVGYSDDDLSNLEVIENLIREKLSIKYPKIQFNIYDTSDPNNPKKKRIVIEK